MMGKSEHVGAWTGNGWFTSWQVYLGRQWEMKVTPRRALSSIFTDQDRWTRAWGLNSTKVSFRLIFSHQRGWPRPSKATDQLSFLCSNESSQFQEGEKGHKEAEDFDCSAAGQPSRGRSSILQDGASIPSTHRTPEDLMCVGVLWDIVTR